MFDRLNVPSVLGLVAFVVCLCALGVGLALWLDGMLNAIPEAGR